jgi:hypothetical protein
MKKLLIGLLALGSISAFAGFEKLDDAQLAVTLKNGDIAPSMTVSIIGIQAKRIYNALESAHGSNKTELNDSLQSVRIESQSQEVTCIQQNLKGGKFYSCAVGLAL